MLARALDTLIQREQSARHRRWAAREAMSQPRLPSAAIRPGCSAARSTRGSASRTEIDLIEGVVAPTSELSSLDRRGRRGDLHGGLLHAGPRGPAYGVVDARTRSPRRSTVLDLMRGSSTRRSRSSSSGGTVYGEPRQLPTEREPAAGPDLDSRPELGRHRAVRAVRPTGTGSTWRYSAIRTCTAPGRRAPRPGRDRRLVSSLALGTRHGVRDLDARRDFSLPRMPPRRPLRRGCSPPEAVGTFNVGSVAGRHARRGARPRSDGAGSRCRCHAGTSARTRRQCHRSRLLAARARDRLEQAGPRVARRGIQTELELGFAPSPRCRQRLRSAPQNRLRKHTWRSSTTPSGRCRSASAPRSKACCPAQARARDRDRHRGGCEPRRIAAHAKEVHSFDLSRRRSSLPDARHVAHRGFARHFSRVPRPRSA